MRLKIKIMIMSNFIGLIALLFISCKGFPEKNKGNQNHYAKQEQEAIGILKENNLYNYLDSAYLYMYIYFGRNVIKRCGKYSIDSILPDLSQRRIISQDLLLTNCRIIPDSSFIFLSLTPLVKDSIVSCDIVEGPQLPDEIMFNYKTKKFIQFAYNETGILKVSGSPLVDYENGLKREIELKKIEPHKRFIELLQKLDPK